MADRATSELATNAAVAANPAPLPERSQDDEAVEAGAYRWLWRWVRPHKRYLLLGLGALTFQVAVEVALPLLFGRGIIDHILLDSGDLGLLTIFALGAVALMAGKGLFVFAHIYFMNFVGQRAVADLRRAIYDHLLRLPLDFFSRRRSGELISR